MAFLEVEVKLKAYSDAAETQFPMNLIPSIDQLYANTALVSAQSLLVNLAASATQTININSIANVIGIYILSDSTDIGVNLNGLGVINAKAACPGFMPLAITSLAITNNSSTATTNVTVIIFGA